MENTLPQKVDRFMAALMANQRHLYQYVHVLLPRQQDAEDVMQNTLLVLWKKFDQFDQSTSFYAWASRVAYLETLSYRRRNNRLVTILDEGLLEQISIEVEAKQDLLEARREAMERCADKLNLLDRQLLDLRYAPGATVKDVARRLGRPANSVSKSLGRIRQALWDCINLELAEAQETVKGDES
ncbi:MAG: sigma-70 family RNA polymerase sigma factor [Pirellulales bacterium]|nr:sigma-70 family RNA polymerase sigma factor [Pirellulales bacterium]